jgi:hypothetical protein
VKNIMKKLLLTTLIALFVFGMTTTAKAVVLAPSGFSIGPFGATSPAGTLALTAAATLTKPINYDNIAGSVTQNVYWNPTANGYLFEYQFTNFPNPASLNAIWRMTATTFTGFTTDADAQTGTGIMPIWLDRSIVGDSVGFQFLSVSPTGGLVGTGITPNSTSALLWIQTNAQFYGSGATHFINGGTMDINMYGPAVPEPTTMLLFGMGVLGLFGIGRKKA